MFLGVGCVAISSGKEVTRETAARSSAASTREKLIGSRFGIPVTPHALSAFPLLMATHPTPKNITFARRPDIRALALQGCATPDHVIRTKRLPMLGRNVAQYATDYAQSFAAYAARAGTGLTMLDPAPRIVLDQHLGLCAFGKTAQDCAVAAEIYDHTIEIILRAHALGGWCASGE